MQEVSENVSVKEYFEECVPKMFEEEMAKLSVSGMDGTTFTVQFDVQNQVYGLTIKDAKDIEISASPLESPIIKVSLAEDTWRKAVTGKMEGAMDMFTDMGQMANRKRYDALSSTKGVMNLELGMQDGTMEKVRIVFNGNESPEVTFKAAMGDWAKVASGEMPGPTAFMGGKLKIDGDMPFAMALANIMV